MTPLDVDSSVDSLIKVPSWRFVLPVLFLVLVLGALDDTGVGCEDISVPGSPFVGLLGFVADHVPGVEGTHLRLTHGRRLERRWAGSHVGRIH